MKIGSMWNYVEASSRSQGANKKPELKNHVVARRCKPLATHFNHIIGRKYKYGELDASAIGKEIC